MSGRVEDAAGAPLEHESLPPAEVVAGDPTTGWVSLGETASGEELGVWEMTVGTARDIEADEVFVVLSGRASVELVDEGTTLELGPGSVGWLDAGTRTVWTVHETLRKVYVTPA